MTTPKLNTAAGYYAENPVLIEEKQTQKIETEYYAKEIIVCKYAYNTRTYAVGEQVGGTYTPEGLHQYDGYVNNVIPWDKIEVRQYVTVREYTTTRWELKKN